MLTPQQQAEAERKLKLLAEEQEAEKTIKNKISTCKYNSGNVSKALNDKLKALIESEPKGSLEVLPKLHEDYVDIKLVSWLSFSLLWSQGTKVWSKLRINSSLRKNNVITK